MFIKIPWTFTLTPSESVVAIVFVENSIEF